MSDTTDTPPAKKRIKPTLEDSLSGKLFVRVKVSGDTVTLDPDGEAFLVVPQETSAPAPAQLSGKVLRHSISFAANL